MVMDMMEFKNLLMLGCLICCMSPCMSQTCIDDKLNNQLQCRYDCSDEVIGDKCSQYNATIHPSIDGYCCPGYFLTNVTKPTCQICRKNMFMPDINKCCGCIICMECDTIPEDFFVDPCTNKTNKQCKIEQDPTTPADVACPFIMTSTGNPPTTIEVNTVQVTSTSDVSVPVLEIKSDSTYMGEFITVLVLLLLLILVVAAVCLCFCFAHKCCAHRTDEMVMINMNAQDQTDGGRIDYPLTQRNVRGVIGAILRGRARIIEHQPRSESGSESGSQQPPAEAGSQSGAESGSQQPRDEAGSQSAAESGSQQPRDEAGSQSGSNPGSESRLQSESQSRANTDGIAEADGLLNKSYGHTHGQTKSK